jgi:hypothetical protein
VTQHKHLKQLVRARMAKTGERYAAARRHVVGEVTAAAPTPGPRFPFHFPGLVPAAAALRVLLAAKGVVAPHTGQPWSEGMAFGIAGGVGAGVFSFFYEQADFASFFVAGRHRWWDDALYLVEAARRFGATAAVREDGGAKAAAASLRAALASGPCVAWVDAAHLPHRVMPPGCSGGGYHVVTVYTLEADGETALIGDLTDTPIPIGLAELAAARARIRKQRHRLLSLAAGPPPGLDRMVRAGLRACHAGLAGEGAIGSRTNCSLEGFRVWAERLHGSRDREGWERVFPPGHRLWRGLTSIYDYVEHYGTGGGLCRPLFADFLAEAAAALDDRPLTILSERYAALGRDWSELADAALPDDVPLFRDAKSLLARKAELTHAGGSRDDLRGVWEQLGALEAAARERFPLGEADSAALRAALQRRGRELYAGEVAAREALAGCLA